MYKAFFALNIYNLVIYNNKKHHFEYINEPNKNGTAGRKLTLNLFK